MSARVVLHRAPRSAWLKHRRAGITATEAVTILGLSPWVDRTQLAVWMDKHNPPPDRHPGWRRYRGRALEAPLAAEYARAHPGTRMDKPPLLLTHPTYPWLLASLDWLAHDRERTRIVECKTGCDWREWADGATPLHYIAQLQIQLAVTGLNEGVLWADVDGRLEERVIGRDDEWLSRAIPLLHRWWWLHVALGRIPPLETSDYCRLNDVWGPDPGEVVEAPPDVRGAVTAWQKLNHVDKGRHALLANLKLAVREHMRTASLLIDPATGERLARINRAGALTIEPYKEEAPT